MWSRNGWTVIRPSRAPPNERKTGRNAEWTHLYNERVMSMPDAWEYPVVCGLGPRFPLHSARARRSEIRQEPARSHPARVVSASERTNSGLRMEFRRRQPAGHRLGRLAGLQNRGARHRQRRSRFPRDDFPQAPDQLYLVGESEGFRGPQYLRGRLSWARQHRGLRSQRAFSRREPARAERRHELDGNVLPHDDANGSRAGAREPGLRKYRDQVFRAFPRDRRGDEQRWRAGNRALG